ncbi:glutamine-hydrolyzing carbamoyl-phosphate synthase small subunit [Thermococcus alcaliphilus]|uniref:glutamine-hydrolyzing carbamoyl-phosphate synthase small subunit n=1 Tax=Thermococcus alcaliphilus TaxID=139207 RepID=UPI00209155E7|nr:glutamine-hydrolyzing carbamoyl-phosphate synthase small subunit [Thermococcus alcaliphilus]
MKAYLLLQDGTIIEGKGFGAEGVKFGEVVFTTSMVGYPESLTDPSYKGQILVMTYPLIGNYGVPSKKIKENGIPVHYESDKIQVEGYVVSKLMRPSHWASEMSLEKWLKKEGVPGIEGVDTRALVKKIRETGVMMGALAVGNYEKEELGEIMEKLRRVNYDKMNFVEEVTPKKPIIHEPKDYEKTVVVIDCGIKYGILRELLKRKFKVIRVPCTYDPIQAFEEFDAEGILLSNGPGNPSVLEGLIAKAEAIIEYSVPTLGICLGSQILALADGGEIYKLKYGHRGINKPVKDLKTRKAFVTTQNHGYAVKPDSLNEFKVWMINLDDGSVEGIYHPNKPIIATQFHPEASPGPLDSTWVFDLFSKLIKGDSHGI